MLPWSELEIILDKLKIAVDNQDFKGVQKLLIETVHGYKPDSDINDLMFSKYFDKS
jgi:hypothetical protein